jgi:hypothetical protein
MNQIKIIPGHDDAAGLATDNRRMSATRISRLLAAALAVTGVLAVAACGSSLKPRVGNPRAIEFATCMRAHGVPSFPDSSGGVNLASAGINPQSPAYRSARQACLRLAPGGNAGSQASESQVVAALTFAKCMRTHGLADFPDPTVLRGLSPGRRTPASILVVGPGLSFRVGQSFDPNAREVVRAVTACGGWGQG